MRLEEFALEKSRMKLKALKEKFKYLKIVSLHQIWFPSYKKGCAHIQVKL